MAVISTHKILIPKNIKIKGKHLFHIYIFRFISVGNHYDIEIIKMPSYGKRPSDLSLTHRIPTGKIDGKWKICFGIPEAINTLDKADKWSKVWAENTTEYILTGKEFPNEK